MNKPFFVGAIEVVPAVGVFDAVAALRGSPRGEGSQCRYPVSFPHLPDFQFCERDAAAGSPYCRSHSELCFKPKGQT